MTEHNHHHHHPSHSHGHSHGNHQKLKWIFLLAASYMLVEIFAGFYSGSLALLADAGHMAIDAASIALSLFAAWAAHRPPNSEKTYGYHRLEILAATINGATLIAISFWICFEAWQRFQTIIEIKAPVMTTVAFGGLLVNLVSLKILHGEHDHVNMKSVRLHILTDLLGSVSAIVAGLLVWQFGWTSADPILSVFISVLILYGAWKLLSECVNILLEGVPANIDLNEVRTSITSHPLVKEVHDLHVWTVTSGVPALSAHVVMKEGSDSALVLKELECMFKEKFKIEHVTLQIEPASFHHHSDHCKLHHH